MAFIFNYFQHRHHRNTQSSFLSLSHFIMSRSVFVRFLCIYLPSYSCIFIDAHAILIPLIINIASFSLLFSACVTNCSPRYRLIQKNIETKLNTALRVDIHSQFSSWILCKQTDISTHSYRWTQTERWSWYHFIQHRERSSLSSLHRCRLCSSKSIVHSKSDQVFVKHYQIVHQSKSMIHTLLDGSYEYQSKDLFPLILNISLA